ncbi:hypothetical protein AC249_AIPGENE2266 [Exaiptasia diaphana]|nr:hypothetical protein AC249_AIPGENE2266 [Exaiptasia diaphana]
MAQGTVKETIACLVHPTMFPLEYLFGIFKCFKIHAKRGCINLQYQDSPGKQTFHFEDSITQRTYQRQKKAGENVVNTIALRIYIFPELGLTLYSQKAHTLGLMGIQG